MRLLSLVSHPAPKGQAMLMAVLLTLGVGAVTGVLLTQSSATDRLLKGPRIRSAMMAAYNRLKLLAINPSSFVCTASAAACSLDMTNAFSPASLDQILPFAKCPTSAPCGVQVFNPVLTASKRITATIRYQGLDVDVQSMPVDIEVPKEVLQVSAEDCFVKDPTRPIFAGFASDGTPICKSIPLPSNCSGPGEYVKSFDPKTFKLTCGNLQTSVGCASSEYMTGLAWDGTNFTATCTPRPDVFSYFAFTPTVTLGAAAVTASPGPTPQNTCTTTTTTTTTTSTTTTTLAGPTTTTVPSSTTSTTSTSTTSTTSPIPECRVLDGSVTRGWGVKMCTPDDASYWFWGDNSCNTANTGYKCCYAWAPVDPAEYHTGETLPYNMDVGGPHGQIGLKCVPYDICDGDNSRCVNRPSERSTNPSTDELGGTVYYNF